MKPFTSSFGSAFLRGYHRGVMGYSYKGIRCLKSPIDLSIYLQLLWSERPRTIIEVGSAHGGSAAFFADQQRVMGLEAEIVSIDTRPPRLELDGVRFLKGDVRALDELFDAHGLYDLPHPWLVVEDSAHRCDTCLAAMEFFANHLRPGELLIIEDGILSELGRDEDGKFGGGPNRAIETYFARHPDVFSIERTLCDAFGQNATYNPNGYLRKL